MLRIDRKKLEPFLSGQNQHLSHLAAACGISRQSLYKMFRGESIFSTPFEKLLNELKVPFEQIVVDDEQLAISLRDAPSQIRTAALTLQHYATQRGADLFLVGSRARGKKGIRADWDFALFFPTQKKPKDFSSVKIKTEEMAFPYRIDVLCLNDAPEWFLNSISADALRLCGTTDRDIIFQWRAS